MTEFRKTEHALVALTPEQYGVTQRNGMERPTSGSLLRNKEAGIHVDVVSGEPLLAGADGYEFGCGWPNLTKPLEAANVKAT